MERPAPPMTPDRAGAWAGLVVGMALLGLYLSSLTADNSHDTVYFAMSAETAVADGRLFAGLFNPQHVMHQITGTAVLWLAHAASIPIGALVIFQVMGSLGGAALGGLVTRLVTRRTGHVTLGVAAGLATGLAGGVWFYAVDGETNLISLAFAVAALEPALVALEGDRRAGVRASVLLALSCGWHLTMGTLWIAILVTALFGGRERVRNAVVLLAGASALLAVLYLPRGILLAREPGPFDPRELVVFTEDVLEGGYLLRSGFQPIGELKGMIGAFLTVAVDRPTHPLSLAFGLIPIGAIALGVLIVATRRCDWLVLIVLGWLTFMLTLYAAWADLDFEFTNFLLVPALLLGALAVGRLDAPRAARAVGVAVIAASLVVGVVNWRGFLAPGLDPRASPFHRIAAMVEANTRPEDRVIVNGLDRSRLKIYVLYHAKRAEIIPEFLFGPHRPEDDSVRAFEDAIDRTCASGARVYSLSEMVEDMPMRPFDGFPLERLRAIVRARRPVEVARDSAGALYRLDDCPPGK